MNCLCPGFTDTDMIKVDDKPGAVCSEEDYRNFSKNVDIMK